MRLFVAVEQDQTSREVAGSVVRDLRRRLGPRVSARWVDVEKMHLTVRFIGHVPDEEVAAVLNALRPPLPTAPFEIVLGECGVFPESGPPRVLWIGLTQGLQPLQAIHDECNRRLSPLGYAPEDRPFNAHVTLARVKDAPRDAARTMREIVAAVQVPSRRCHVNAATVFQSSPSPKGSTYTKLLTAACKSEG
jgi:2'-5' RNA ligase